MTCTGLPRWHEQYEHHAFTSSHLNGQHRLRAHGTVR